VEVAGSDANSYQVSLSAFVQQCLSDSSFRYPMAVIYGRVRG